MSCVCADATAAAIANATVAEEMTGNGQIAGAQGERGLVCGDPVPAPHMPAELDSLRTTHPLRTFLGL
jgi:hypothetical protein